MPTKESKIMKKQDFWFFFWGEIFQPRDLHVSPKKGKITKMPWARK